MRNVALQETLTMKNDSFALFHCQQNERQQMAMRAKTKHKYREEITFARKKSISEFSRLISFC